MDRKQRVFNGTTDISGVVSSYRNGTSAIGAQLLVGAELPFNHKHFDLAVVNATARVLSKVELWTGSAWLEVVDLKDGTAVGGVAFGKTGTVSWQRNLMRAGWGRQQESTKIPDLANGPMIYNLYWARFTWSNGDGAATVRYIGERFNDDEDLFSLYPDLRPAAVMQAYEPGKTSWNEQCVTAGDAVVRHLRGNNVIVRREQIMDTSLYSEAGVHKTAHIIFRGLGNGWMDRAVAAQADFLRAVNIKYPEVDSDGSGDVSDCERGISTTWITR